MNDHGATSIRIPRPGLPGRWWRFDHPSAVLCASRLGEVLPVLHEASRAQAAGHHVLGFVAYEAGPAFDPALTAHPPDPAIPLAWFGVFGDPVDDDPPHGEDTAPPAWRPRLDRDAYVRHVAAIRDAIARGATYQVNFTFPMTADGVTDPDALFSQLYDAQPTRYAMRIDTPAFAVCSVTPEIFFHRDGNRIFCWPMKGTALRAATPEADAAVGRALAASAKNRAENLMIVDMIRNDLSRIAGARDVRVSCLFDAEPLPTVWQMTSTVEAEAEAEFPGLMSALFPCASITGAPKVETSRIIAAREAGPRGIYTGAIGYLEPGGAIRMQVAIRTAWIDKSSGRATYGVGSGVVWDSDPDAEYDECLAKAAILTGPRFGLLETMRYNPGRGIHLLDRHLARLANSADHFGIPLDPEAIRRLLDHAVAELTAAHRVRLVARAGGDHAITTAPEGDFAAEPDPGGAPLRIADRPFPVDSQDQYLYHKTVRREVYDAARATLDGADDIVLVNEQGEVTEFTYGNLVLQRGDAWLTPPVRCGLLGGVMRGALLDEGRMREAVLTWDDLANGTVWFINSVRGWRRCAFL